MDKGKLTHKEVWLCKKWLWLTETERGARCPLEFYVDEAEGLVLQEEFCFDYADSPLRAVMCKALFPEVEGECPCNVLGVEEVTKRVKAAIRESV